MPVSVAADETLHGELFEDNGSLSQIVQDFEFRLRDHVEAVALIRTEGVQQCYQDKLMRIRKVAAIEVRKRQELSRKRYELQYKKKELQLRAHYKRLMAPSNKISEQKAQLQRAKNNSRISCRPLMPSISKLKKCARPCANIWTSYPRPPRRSAVVRPNVRILASTLPSPRTTGA